MDEEGYVYSQIIPEATDPKHVERLLYGTNERIFSRFSASYSTILGLYSRYGENAFPIFRRSLHNFRSGTFSLAKQYQKEEEQIRNRIAFLQDAGFLDGIALTEKGGLAAASTGMRYRPRSCITPAVSTSAPCSRSRSCLPVS
jgi:hypothetical protein